MAAGKWADVDWAEDFEDLLSEHVVTFELRQRKMADGRWMITVTFHLRSVPFLNVVDKLDQEFWAMSSHDMHPMDAMHETAQRVYQMVDRYITRITEGN